MPIKSTDGSYVVSSGFDAFQLGVQQGLPPCQVVEYSIMEETLQRPPSLPPYPYPLHVHQFSLTGSAQMQAPLSPDCAVESLPLPYSAQCHISSLRSLGLDVEQARFESNKGGVSHRRLHAEILHYIPPALEHISNLKELGVEIVGFRKPSALPDGDTVSSSIQPNHHSSKGTLLIAFHPNQQQLFEEPKSAFHEPKIFSSSSFRNGPTALPGSAINASVSTRQIQNTKGEQEPAKQFFCTFPDCKQEFTVRSDWKRHEEEKHEDNVEYTCKKEDCKSRSHRRRKAFNRHINKSDECKKKSVSAANCRTYIGLKKAWGCGFCAETFYEWSERVTHVRKHQDEGMQKIEWSHSRVILGLLNQRAMEEHWTYLKKEVFEQIYPDSFWEPIPTMKLQDDLEHGGRGDKARLVKEAQKLFTKGSSTNYLDYQTPYSTLLSSSESLPTWNNPRQYKPTNSSDFFCSSMTASSASTLESSFLPDPMLPMMYNTGDVSSSSFQPEYASAVNFHGNQTPQQNKTTPIPMGSIDDSYGIP